MFDQFKKKLRFGILSLDTLKLVKGCHRLYIQ